MYIQGGQGKKAQKMKLQKTHLNYVLKKIAFQQNKKLEITQFIP